MKPQMPTLPTETLATESSVDIQEQLRRRAFELYEQRGREGGHDLDDWLQAESELVQQRTKAVAA
jgi:outer membrane protein TolC